MCRSIGVILAALISVTRVPAQFPVRQREIPKVIQAFNEPAQGNSLKCSVETVKPFLDFGFRFQVAYIARCALVQFGGNETQVVTYIRVRRASGAPTILGDVYRIPAIPKEMQSDVNFRRLNAEIEFSGAFAVGEGEYPVELLILDNQQRVFRKSWKAKAVTRKDEHRAALALKPDTVGAVVLPSWNSAERGDTKRLRLTILLDAAPINPTSSKLRAWDRAFLLDSLASLLRQFPSKSVRLIAFNLDQQKEIYRREDFDRRGFRELARALQELELGSISYTTLQRQQGWSSLLAKLTNEELTAAQASDLVIFLGPNTRISGKIPREMLSGNDDFGRHLYYLEYYWHWGNEFPDAIQRLTTSYNGTVLKIHSPGEFADAIQKLRRKELE